MRYTGAQLIVRLLEQQGITLVSGIPGGAALPLYDALGQSRIIRHVGKSADDNDVNGIRHNAR